MRRFNTQIPVFSETCGLIRQRWRIVLSAALLTCCTLLLLPLTEYLVREEDMEEKTLRTRQVNTLTLSPPESTEDQKREKEDSPKETSRRQEESLSTPENAFKFEDSETDTADLDHTAPEFDAELDMEADFDIGDFELNFSEQAQGDGKGQAQATDAAGQETSAPAGKGDRSFSAGELDREPTPQARLQPRYPHAARMKGQEGYVVVRFVVTEEGEVVDAEVQDAEPPGVFDEAALQAVENWRFEPGKNDGEKVRSRLQQRIRFNLD